MNINLLTFLNIDTDMPEVNLFDNKHRGRADLKAVRYELYKNVPIEGAPTSFTLLLCPPHDAEKWKLCASSKDDQSRWSAILERFTDVKIPSLLTTPSYFRGSVVFDEPPVNAVSSATDGGGSSMSSPPLPTILPHQSSVTFGDKHRKKRLKTKSEVAGGSDFQECLVIIAILNVCIYSLIYTRETTAKVVYIIIVNVVTYYSLSLRSDRLMKQIKTITGLQQKIDDLLEVAAVDLNASRVDLPIASVVTSPQASTEVGLKPKPAAGSTLKQVFTPPLKSPVHTWCKCDYRMFNVRIGPDYSRYKKKAPSPPSIYEPFAVDAFW